MKRTGFFIGGVIAGAAIGSALGLLFAPRSGKETREQLKTKLVEMEHELEKIRNKAKEKGLELKDEIKSKVSDLEKKFENLASDLKKTPETKV